MTTRTRILLADARVASAALAADAASEANPNRGLRALAEAPVIANRVADV